MFIYLALSFVFFKPCPLKYTAFMEKNGLMMIIYGNQTRKLYRANKILEVFN